MQEDNSWWSMDAKVRLSAFWCVLAWDMCPYLGKDMTQLASGLDWLYNNINMTCLVCLLSEVALHLVSPALQLQPLSEVQSGGWERWQKSNYFTVILLSDITDFFASLPLFIICIICDMNKVNAVMLAMQNLIWCTINMLHKICSYSCQQWPCKSEKCGSKHSRSSQR